MPVMRTDYRLAPAVRVRALGGALVALGVVLALVAGLVGVLHWPTRVLSVAMILAVTAMVTFAVVVMRVTVVRTDEDGYRVSFVRGAGVTRACWADVEDATTGFAAGHPVVVLHLGDGRTTTIPVGLITAAGAGAPDSFVRALQGRLNRGHGYRRLT